MSAIFSVSLAPFCKRISLPLFISIFHLQAPSLVTMGGKKGMGRPEKKKCRFPSLKNSQRLRQLNRMRAPTSTYSHTKPPPPPPPQHTPLSLFTCSTFTAGSETDSIYIISRAYNNSQLQPALLHEYIEGRFPATLFHDWTPKDKRLGREEKKWKFGGKWRGSGESWTRCFEGLACRKCSIRYI